MMEKKFLLPKLSKLSYIILVFETLTASNFTSELGNGRKYFPSAPFWNHLSKPSNLTEPFCATTKCAVARSGPSISSFSGINLHVYKIYTIHICGLTCSLFYITYNNVCYLYRSSVECTCQNQFCLSYYRHPCIATVADYVLLLFIFIFLFFLFFYSPFVLRNYSTDYHKIFRDCVFWCSLNSPVVLKFFWRHLAEKNAKNSKNLVKISWIDSDFWL